MRIRSRQTSVRPMRRLAHTAPVSPLSLVSRRRALLNFGDARRISACVLAMGSTLCAGALLTGPVLAAPVVGSDENGPLVSIIKPGYNDVLKGKYRILIAVTAKKYNPQSVEIFVDDVSATGGPKPISSLASSSFDWDTRGFSDGPHKLTVRVTDSQGFRGWSEVRIFVNNGQVVDTTPPDLRWVGIEPFQQVSGQMQIEVDAADNFGVKMLQIFVNPADKPNQVPATFSWFLNQPPYRVSLDTVGKRMPDGLYSLRALAYDSLDQQGEAPPLTFGVVNSPISATTVAEMLQGRRDMAKVIAKADGQPAPKPVINRPVAPKPSQTPAPRNSYSSDPAPKVTPPATSVPLKSAAPDAQARAIPQVATPPAVVSQVAPSQRDPQPSVPATVPSLPQPTAPTQAATSANPPRLTPPQVASPQQIEDHAPETVLAQTPEVETKTPVAPEVTAPEVTAPEVTAPEVTAPEVTAPEVTAPEAQSDVAASAQTPVETKVAPNSTENTPTESSSAQTPTEKTPAFETPASETSVAETVAPEAKIPEAVAPKIPVAQTPTVKTPELVKTTEPSKPRLAEIPRPLSNRYPAQPGLSQLSAPAPRMAPVVAPVVAARVGQPINVARLTLPGIYSRRVAGAPVLSQNGHGDDSRVSLIRNLSVARLIAPSPQLSGVARAVRASAPTLIERAVKPTSNLVREASVKPHAKQNDPSKAIARGGRLQPIEIAPQMSAIPAPRIAQNAPSPLAKAVTRAEKAPRIAARPRPDAATSGANHPAISIVPVAGPLEIGNAANVPASYTATRTTTLRAVAARFGLPVELVALSNNWVPEMKVLKGMTVKLPRPLQVSYNGVPVTGDAPSMILGETGVTAFRFMFERSGGKLEWDAKNQRVVARKGEQEITLNIGSNIAKVGDKEVAMELAAFLFEGRTMVPLRFFEEGLNAQVDWNPQTGRLVVAMAG